MKPSVTPRVTPWTKIPDYINPDEMTTGILGFDDEKCKRCGICTFICPARSIKSDTGQMKWRGGLPWLSATAPQITNCIACGCCLAACPEGAITIERWFNPGHFYQRLTQTSEMVPPRCYQEADTSATVEMPDPDPKMLQPEYGVAEKLKMRWNSLKVSANAIWGISNFFASEARHKTLGRTIKPLLSKNAMDISWAELLEKNAARVPNKPFLLYKDERYTYRQMDDNANKIANYLQSLGGGRGKGIGILLKNSPRYLDLFFGCQKLGMYAVTINTELRGNGLAYVVNHSDIDLLVVEAELYAAIQPAFEKFESVNKIIFNDVEAEAEGITVPDGMERLSRAYTPNFSTENPGVGYNPEDMCLLMYTSGTTGPPKGVVYRYNNTTVSLMVLGGNLLLKPNDVYYTAFALCHGNALLATTTFTMGAKATLALARKFSASRFWDDIKKFEVTTFNTIGSIIPILMKQPEKANDSQNKVHHVTSSGCPPDMWVPFEKRFGVKLFEAYGAIDGGGKGVFNFGNAPVGSLGRIPKSLKHRLVDEHGNDVPLGIPGELIFEAKKTKSRVEYYKNEEASKKKSGDGWLHTGDLVKKDKNGFVYFVGRNTESMRKGGENVSAYEVEQVIMDHPAVEEVAVYAVPSELAEDEIMASIRLVDGKELAPAELRTFLTDKLAKFAIPRYIRIVDAFTKTHSHRIIKRGLEEEGVTKDTFDALNP